MKEWKRYTLPVKCCQQKMWFVKIHTKWLKVRMSLWIQELKHKPSLEILCQLCPTSGLVSTVPIASQRKPSYCDLPYQSVYMGRWRRGEEEKRRGGREEERMECELRNITTNNNLFIKTAPATTLAQVSTVTIISQCKYFSTGEHHSWKNCQLFWLIVFSVADSHSFWRKGLVVMDLD